MKNRLGIYIGILCLAVSLLLFSAFYMRSEIPRSGSEEEFGYRENEVPPPAPADVKVDKNILIRQNMFHPLRGEQPAVATAPAASAKPSPPELLVLTGVFQFDQTKGAVIAVPSGAGGVGNSEVKRVFKLGDEVGNGYTLEQIAPDQVTLTRGNEQKILPLRKKQEHTP